MSSWVDKNRPSVSFYDGDDDKTLQKEANEAGIFELSTKRSGHPNGLALWTSN